MVEEKTNVPRKNSGKGRKSVRSFNSWRVPSKHKFFVWKYFTKKRLPSERLTEVNVF